MNGRQRPPSGHHASVNGSQSSNVTLPGSATPGHVFNGSLALPAQTSAKNGRPAPMTPGSSFGSSPLQRQAFYQQHSLAQRHVQQPVRPSAQYDPIIPGDTSSTFDESILLEQASNVVYTQRSDFVHGYNSPPQPHLTSDLPYPSLPAVQQQQDRFTGMFLSDVPVKSIEGAMFPPGTLESGQQQQLESKGPSNEQHMDVFYSDTHNDGDYDDTWDAFDKRTCVQCDKPVPKKMKGNLCRRCQHKKEKEEAGPPTIAHIHMEAQEARDIIHASRPALVPDNQSEQNLRMRQHDLAINSTPHGVEHWIGRILLAMNEPYDLTMAEANSVGRNIDQHNALLKTQVDFNKKFFDQPAQYELHRINARVRLLWDTVVCLHQGGVLPYEEGGDNSGYNVDTELKFSARLARICDMLQLDKRICIDVIEGRGVTAFARDPWSYEKRKQDNITSNNKKSKAAKDRAGVSNANNPSLDDPAQQTIRFNKLLIADPKRDGKIVGQKRKSEAPSEYFPTKRQATGFRPITSAANNAGGSMPTHGANLRSREPRRNPAVANAQQAARQFSSQMPKPFQQPTARQQQTPSETVISGDGSQQTFERFHLQQSTGHLSREQQRGTPGVQRDMALFSPQQLVTPDTASFSSAQTANDTPQSAPTLLGCSLNVTTVDGMLEQYQESAPATAAWQMPALQVQTSSTVAERLAAGENALREMASSHMGQQLHNDASNNTLAGTGSWLMDDAGLTQQTPEHTGVNIDPSPATQPAAEPISPFIDYNQPIDVAGAASLFGDELYSNETWTFI